MNASSLWWKQNVNLNRTSSSLISCQFQTKVESREKEILGNKSNFERSAMSKSNPWCGQELLDTCVLRELSNCHAPSISIKIPSESKTITSYDRNARGMYAYLFYKVICFNQQWMSL